MDAVRQSGIEVVGAVPWGTHFCQFYETSQDLIETLVPYFREGLAANEFCMWVTSSPLQVEEAKAALRAVVPDLDDYIARGQIEILDYSDWYTKWGEFRADEVLQGWVDKHDEALRRGYEGLRLTGNTLWLEQTVWEDFSKYEEKINDIIGQYRMLAICTYSLEKCGALEIADVIANHQFALIKRSGGWQIIESSRHRMTEAALLEASRSLLRHREFEAAARSIFDSCKKLIGATAGYVAMLSRDGTENEVLFLESGGLPCSVDASLPMPIRGLRAAAYEGGKTVYENDFANSEWVRFLPQGHAQLHNVLFAPLAVDGAVVGLHGLANKPGGFTEDDARTASAFAELAAVALHNSRTLEALEHSEERYRSLVETAVDAIISIDSDGNIILWNHSAESMFGYRAHDVMGKPLDFIMPERFREAHQEAFQRVLSTGKSNIIGKTAELAGLRRTGVEFPLELSLAKWGSGDAVFFTAVIRDITERKQAEQAKEMDRQRLQTLVDTSPVGIVVVDATGHLVSINQEAERLLGAPASVGDSVEQYSHAIVCRRPDGSQYAPGELPVERALNLGETVRAEEIHFHRPDGSVVPVLVNAVPLYGPNCEITGALAVQQDITPLEELERLRNEFLGIVSHELRTPLTAIKGSAATVLGSSSPLSAEQTRELFQIIDEQADRLRDLIADLLDVTRIEAGALSIEAAPTDLRDIIQEAHESFLRAVCVREVRLELPDALPLVRADRQRIGQVMTNLLSNAAKFSPPSTPITVSVEHGPVYVTVRVRDEGHGIAEEDLAKLFRKYSRPHEKSGLGLAGSGLGLAICKGIVEAHGGRIWAESEGKGRGATFSFTLLVAAEAATALETGVATRVSRRGERKRILAVDDEVHVLRYLQRSLSEAGYEPVVASDPSEVSRLVELNEPDLILLDLRFPGTSGFEVMERVRELTEAPVIFLTASDREDDAVRALRMGADDYIVKPFSPSELLARVDAVLRRRAGAPTTAARRPFVLGDLRIDFAQRQVTLAGKPVALSATEWKLLSQLAAHAGMVVTYEQILERVWGPAYGGETELVRSFIRNLRRKLGDDARNPKFILTERGVGYRMPPPES